MMDRLTEDQVEEGHDTAFVKALVMDIRELRERVVVSLSAAGAGVSPTAEWMAVRCGRLGAFDEVLRMIRETQGKESDE